MFPSFKFSPIDESLIDLTLTEDLGLSRSDATSDLLFADNNKNQQAKIISKHPEKIIICGIEVACVLLKKIDSNCQIKTDHYDGQELLPGQTLLELNGNANALLKAERIILNFLRHLSAIATLTAKYVEKVKTTPLKILDTRKTTPGLRHLEKYAVHCGGGLNHRMGLYDAIMIKDTHVDLCGGMQQALRYLPEKNNIPVIVEIRSTAELDEVIKYGKNKVDRVLLDNMSIEQLQACVQKCHGIFATEASGNISLDNILEIAKTGVQYASVGKLTYAAGHVDLSMQSIGNPLKEGVGALAPGGAVR